VLYFRQDTGFQGVPVARRWVDNGGFWAAGVGYAGPSLSTKTGMK
jgi:hypothetical protein